jgi:catechol 2,3-dioxygenase-like lactoylglutathione lyase family enzyme
VPARLHHMGLLMRDFEATARFYGEVLGWKITKRSGLGPAGWVEFQGATPAGVSPRLLVVSFDDDSYLTFGVNAKIQYTGDEPHIALKLRHYKERRDLMARLKDAGVEVEVNEGENIAFYDPSGLRIEIY